MIQCLAVTIAFIIINSSLYQAINLCNIINVEFYVDAKVLSILSIS
jgi:hypothetical protein